MNHTLTQTKRVAKVKIGDIVKYTFEVGLWDDDQIGWTNHYVKFQELVKECYLAGLPDGFAMEASPNVNLFSTRCFENEDLLGFHIEVQESSAHLAEWVRRLPEINNQLIYYQQLGQSELKQTKYPT